ncbi:hypothetical protein, partial [Serratia ureilytica]|uniref:hypothetical protein n=1 Tax=Serratia ureilytica TaxID=300181 RepID=UPI001E479543
GGGWCRCGMRRGGLGGGWGGFVDYKFFFYTPPPPPPAGPPTFSSLDDLDPVHSLRKICWAMPFLPYTVHLYSHMEIAQ